MLRRGARALSSSPAPAESPLARVFSIAVVAIPAFFLGGIALKDFADAARAEEAWVTRRVAQRLGEWTPPALDVSEREVLVLERDAIVSEISRLEARAAERSRRAAGSGSLR